MTTRFQYEAKGGNGTRDGGVVEAAGRREALEILARQGVFPTSLREVSGASPPPAAVSSPAAPSSPTAPSSPAALSPVVPAAVPSPSGPPPTGPSSSRASAPEPAATSVRPAAAPARATPDATSPRRRGHRVSRRDVTAFTRELAALLAATVPIPRALDGLASECESEGLREVLETLCVDVRSGRSLSAGLRSYPELFPDFYTSMIEVGEESGRLDQVLTDLADLLESTDEMRSEVASAVAYPLFVLALGAVTTFVLLAFVLPKLFGMLAEMVDVLPLPTRILLGVAEFFGNWWLGILIAVIGSFLALRWYSQTPAGAVWLDTVKLRAPVLGGLFRTSALARFARMLGTMEKAGVPLLQGLEVVRGTVGNIVVGRIIGEVAEDTRGGESLAAPLARTKLFPPTMIQMISVGEETGQLDAMLLRVAAMQERTLQTRSRALISLLGPFLILLVGAIVGFIVIALLLPIFQMSQALR